MLVNKNMNFDVIIPVAGKDVGFMPFTVNYIRKNIIGVNRIFAITNKGQISKLSRIINDDGFMTLDENDMIDGLTFSNVKKLLRQAGENRPSQTGWYFQQFLKFAFAHTGYADTYYLSWDADTLPVNRICFFDEKKPLFTKKIEFHQPYFETMVKLIGIKRQVGYSFIAEHMMFNTDVVNELTERIMKSDVVGNTWFEKIINACDFPSGKANLYSEFEIYGNFCMKYHPEMYNTRYLNTFRAAGLIKGRHINEHIIDRLAVDLHIASFEMQDAPFPYNIEWNIYRVKRKIINMLTGGGG